MSPKNPGASAYNRLQEVAKKTNRPFQELLFYYAIERLLYRISKSKYSDRFILKGALLLHTWNPDLARSTKDIDLLGKQNNDPAAIAKTFKEIVSIETDDGTLFDSKTVEVEKITEDADYSGVRVTFMGHLGSAKIPMQVDIGFGDVITPKPTEITYPSLLSQPEPHLKAYPKETVVAEKFQAMVDLGIANSRLKDFYDLWFLAGQFEFDGPLLKKAIVETFKNRETTIVTNPVGLSKEFAENPMKQSQWKAFTKRTRLSIAPEDLDKVVEKISEFLIPVAKAALSDEKFSKSWRSPGPWKNT